jgi:hypothetical protein
VAEERDILPVSSAIGMELIILVETLPFVWDFPPPYFS